MIKLILSYSPFLEFIFRISYRVAISFEVFNFLKKLARKYNKNLTTANSHVCVDDLVENINENIIHNIQSEKILLIHSSGSELNKAGINEVEFVDKLIKKLGPDSTIFAPAIPIIRNKKNDFSYNPAKDLGIYEYNIEKSPIWTGSIPRIIHKINGSIRSNIPINSMVGLGKYAEKVNAPRNIDYLYPCGKNSPWYFCYEKNATVLFLGVDPTHSMTMIHVAEDAFHSNWRVRNWYSLKTFNVVDKHDVFQIKIYERNPYWSIRYAERNLARVLIKNNILKKVKVNGLDLFFCESRALVDFLRSRNLNGFPYSIFPWELLQ